MQGSKGSDRGTGEIADALAELWEEQRPTMLERVGVLEDAAAALAGGTLQPELRAAARGAAHKLRGSAGTYGFPHASELAAELEEVFAAESIPVERTPQIAGVVLALRADLEGEPKPPGAAAAESRADGGLLVISDDAGLGAGLGSAAAAAGSRTVTQVPPDEAVQAVRARKPALVLVDAPLAGSPEAAMGLLAELREEDPDIRAVVLVAAADELLDRVDAVHRGARGFIDRGLEPADLLASAEHFLGPDRRATVIAVDDDPAVLAALRALLEPRGFEYVPVSDPTEFWDRLSESDPDLAVIDLDMPRIDGLDLCRAVRSDPAWAHLPLLILTAYRDPEFVRSAFGAGADDFVSKPIVEDELLTRIGNRLERVRASQESTGRDPLTGLPSRQRALAHVAEVLAASPSGGAAVVLIAVKGLEQLNERAGQRAGDDRLRELAARLEQEFPPVVGRYRGATFIAVLPQMPAGDPGAAVGAVLDSASDPRSGLELVAAVAPAEPGSLDTALGAAEQALKRPEGPRVRVAGAARRSTAVDVAVVEDDESVADVLALALDTLGLSSRRFTEGPAAVGALAGADPELSPRVILLDWDLPGLDGFSILQRLAADERLEETRVIMLTARAGEQETVKALEVGAFDYVAKPFSVPVLVERLRRALER